MSQASQKASVRISVRVLVELWAFAGLAVASGCAEEADGNGGAGTGAGWGASNVTTAPTDVSSTGSTKQLPQ